MRRIPLSRRSHVTGFRPIGKRAVEHESALERDFVTLTTFIDADAEITSQPVTIRFDEAGTARRYTPDFLVRWSSGRQELVEVKYRADLRVQWGQLRPAFAAARVWAREHGAQFRIATEHGIRGPRLVNAMRLLPLRGGLLDATASEAVLSTVRSLVAPTFGEVVDALPFDRATALSTVWRMIAAGLLDTNLTAPVRFDTPVWAPFAPDLTQVSQSDWEVARGRLAVIRPLAETADRTRSRVAEAAFKIGCGVTQAYDLLARYLANPTLSRRACELPFRAGHVLEQASCI